MADHETPPKMHADEVSVPESLVRSLLSSQFPDWADLPLRRVSSTGTDNAIYRLGDDLGVRLPRIHWAVSQVDLEWEWLRQLESQLPVSVPTPLAKGEPGFGYPCRWLVYPWLEGEDLQHARGVDLNKAAREIAAFVAALQQIDIGGNPPEGKRAGSLAPLDEGAGGRSGSLKIPSTSIVRWPSGRTPYVQNRGSSLPCGHTGISSQPT